MSPRPRPESARQIRFKKNRKCLGPLAFKAIPLILNSALAGLGLAYLPEDLVQDRDEPAAA